MESENDTEAFLCAEVKRLGGKAYKFISPGNAGVPDRLVVLPENCVFFVELKSEGRKSTGLQRKKHAELRAMGCTVYAEIDTKEKVREVLQHEISSASVSAILHPQDP